MQYTSLQNSNLPAARRATGVPQPRTVLVPYDVREPVTDGLFTASPCNAPASLANAPYLSWYEANAKRYPRGPAETDYEKQQRRLSVTFSAPSEPITSKQATHVYRAFAHRAICALAWPTPAALHRLPSLGLSLEERKAIVGEVDRAPEGFYEHDCEGRELDARHEAELAAERAERERARLAEEAQRRPNTSTCYDLESFAVKVEKGDVARKSWPRFVHKLCGGVRDPEAWLRTHHAVEEDATTFTFLIAKDVVLGLEVPLGKLGQHAAAVLPGTHVPSCTAATVKGKIVRRLDADSMLDLLASRGTPTSTSAGRDLRTAEGEAAFEQFKAHIATFADRLTSTNDRERSVHQDLAAELFRYGYGLDEECPELLFEAYEKVVAPRWKKMVPGEDLEVTKFTTPDGEEVDPLDVKRSQSGAPYIDAQGEQISLMGFHDVKPYIQLIERTTREPRPPQRAPLPWTLATMAANLKRPARVISADECYQPPSPSFVERFRDFFAPDAPWIRALEPLTMREHFLSEDVENSLISAGLVTSMSNAEHARARRILDDMGWEKRQRRINGQLVRAFGRKDGDQ